MIFHWVLVLNMFYALGGGSNSSSVTIEGFNSEATCEARGALAMKELQTSELRVKYICVKTDKVW